MRAAVALLLTTLPLFSFAEELTFKNLEEAPAISMKEDEVAPEMVSPRPTRSEYFYFPGRGRSAVEIQYGTSSSEKTLNGSEAYYSGMDFYDNSTSKQDTQDYSFGIQYGLPRNWYASFGAGYRSTSTTFSGSDNGTFPAYGGYEARAEGLRDFEFGLAYVPRSSGLIFVRGLNVQASLGKSQRATATSRGNSYSGGYTVAPMLGLESGFSGGLVGARATTTFVYGRTEEDAYNNRRSVDLDPVLGLQGFYEFPLVSFASMGVVLGLDQSIGGKDVDTVYLSKLYSSVTVLKETSLNLSLQAQTVEQGNSTTQVEFGVRKTL